jgi:lipopolysaccharide/colanic/teichoic acid biosynthesis glycosyltransferase
LQRKFGLFAKEIFDKANSSVALALLLPIFLLVAIAIKLDSKGPIFFIQERVGKDGKIFRAYKLRTMIDNAEKIGLGYEIAKDDNRITRVGKHLRWGIDELPQLINVFKGDMSMVGPRPALPHQIEKYTKKEKQRLEVKPGITGWALINGRNKLTWPEKIKLDIWCIDH